MILKVKLGASSCLLVNGTTWQTMRKGLQAPTPVSATAAAKVTRQDLCKLTALINTGSQEDHLNVVPALDGFVYGEEGHYDALISAHEESRRRDRHR